MALQQLAVGALVAPSGGGDQLWLIRTGRNALGLSHVYTHSLLDHAWPAYTARAQSVPSRGYPCTSPHLSPAPRQSQVQVKRAS